ncbi:MAG: CAP domain-containing protein [Polyangiales bacterium]
MLPAILLLALLVPASALADAGEGMPECDEDIPLSRAAAELLLQARAPSPEALTAAVREAGSDLVGVRAYLWHEGERGARDWLAKLAQGADAMLVCGNAQNERTRIVLAALRGGTLAPLTRTSTLVRGSLSPGFRDPELVIADASGELQRVRLDAARLSKGVTLADELPRPAKVQLLARGPSGPRPLAERILPAADPNAKPLASPRAAPELAQQGDANAAALLSALRRDHGRPALRENALLGKVASAHAQRVCGEGRVAHELEPGEDPERRLREAGVQAHRVGETVSRAPTASAAFSAFERSPSHLLTLLEPSFTDAGTGVASDTQGRNCVVVLLAAWPRFVGK